MDFSIIIPTYNNIDYLKLCINSLKKNSKFNHEYIFHVNDGSDGTLHYLKENNYKLTHSIENIGLCRAVNNGSKIATKKFLVYAHDDMYFCPNWDIELSNEIKKIGKEKDFFLSGTMIQPFKSFIHLDCGSNLLNFDEKKLLENYNKVLFHDFQGTTWAPSLVPIKTWNKVGGFSEEYTYGLGSDPDFNMKLWNIGVRLFKGISKSRVYHFSSVSLRSKVWNDGHKTFLLKWGISIKFFRKHYLRSDTIFKDELSDPIRNIDYYFDLIKCKFKLFFLRFLNLFASSKS